MQNENTHMDPREKELENQKSREQETDKQEEGVYLYNDDGTPMDTSDRTYISVDLPEENGPDQSPGE